MTIFVLFLEFTAGELLTPFCRSAFQARIAAESRSYGKNFCNDRDNLLKVTQQPRFLRGMLCLLCAWPHCCPIQSDRDSRGPQGMMSRKPQKERYSRLYLCSLHMRKRGYPRHSYAGPEAMFHNLGSGLFFCSWGDRNWPDPEVQYSASPTPWRVFCVSVSTCRPDFPIPCAMKPPSPAGSWHCFNLIMVAIREIQTPDLTCRYPLFSS
jgi:hypothetical protein